MWLLLLSVCVSAVAEPVLSNSDTTGLNITSTYNGEFLQSLGQKLDEPLLKLLGKTVQELEKNRASLPGVFMKAMCANHECGRWSEWTRCRRESLSEFGTSTRFRECGVNNTICSYSPDMFRNETDSRLCEVKANCWSDCYSTTHGSCLKYFEDVRNQSQADASCREKCGDLVKIDSQEKVADIFRYQQSDTRSWSSNIWVAGIRDSISSQWRYRHGGKLGSYRRWKSGQPSDIANELCIVINSDGYWLDRECDKVYGYICEF